MAETKSNMLPLGTKAPDFKLPDTRSGKTASLQELKSDKGTVVMFLCNHCPYVIHIQKKLVDVAKHYQTKGISFIAISSNDAVTHPADGPKEMRHEAEAHGYTFPYLYDESQQVAKAYDAACTPDFFLFDGDMMLVYRGQLDGSRPGNGLPVTGEDLRAALDAVLSGKPVSSDQKPSAGCNIKWKGQ